MHTTSSSLLFVSLLCYAYPSFLCKLNINKYIDIYSLSFKTVFPNLPTQPNRTASHHITSHHILLPYESMIHGE